MVKPISLQANLVAINEAAGIYIYTFLPAKQQSGSGEKEELTFMLEADKVIDLFPAGEPSLEHDYLITLVEGTDHAELVDVFDLKSEVILATNIPEYVDMQRYDKGVIETMDLQALEDKVAADIKSIAEDEQLQKELESFRQEEIADRSQKIEQRLKESGLETIFTQVDVETTQSEEVEPTIDLSNQVQQAGD